MDSSILTEGGLRGVIEGTDIDVEEYERLLRVQVCIN
jgi:hypothetical protein